MAHRHRHYAQIAKAFARIPRELEDGKVRCLGCSAVVGLTKNGHMRRHKSTAGEDCAYTATYAAPVHLDELPPVVVPPQSRERMTATQRERERESSRLDAGSECQDCGRWLPGERMVCGKCQRARNVAKGRKY